MLLDSRLKDQLQTHITKLVSFIGSEVDSPQDSKLEFCYYAGKQLSLLGEKRFRAMTRVQLLARMRGYQPTEADYAYLKFIRSSFAIWLASLEEDLTKRLRVVVVNFEVQWAEELIDRYPDGTLRKSVWNDLRLKYLSKLTSAINAVLGTLEGLANRLVSTELWNYFQLGQTSALSYDDVVYKIPLLDACEHCFRLHLNADGTPKQYRLSEVRANSNVGKKAAEWQFVIGSTHPHCRCVMYAVADKQIEAYPVLAQNREEVLGAAVKRREKRLARQVKNKI